MAENYNPQIHTEELSLATQMEKAPEVHKGVLSRFQRYTKVSSFLMETGRVDGGVQNGLITRAGNSQKLYDNAYRVQYKGLNILPAYAMGGIVFGAWHATDDMTAITGATYNAGTAAGTIATNTLFSIAIKHEPTNGIYGDKFNPNDYIGIVIDESSILKNFDGKTRNEIINKFQSVKYKLACTATPSPTNERSACCTVCMSRLPLSTSSVRHAY